MRLGAKKDGSVGNTSPIDMRTTRVKVAFCGFGLLDSFSSSASLCSQSVGLLAQYIEWMA